MAKEYKQGNMLVMELDEHEWYGPGLDTEALQDGYRDKARAQLCSHVVVFVIPDPVFPMCGHDHKHRVYEHLFPSASGPIRINAVFSGEIDAEVYGKLSEKDQRTMVRRVRDELNEHARGVPGRYCIALDTGAVLERGRV